jgi:hypothetical protein
MTKRILPKLDRKMPRYFVVLVLLYGGSLVYYLANRLQYASNTTKLVAVCKFAQPESTFGDPSSSGKRPTEKVRVIKKDKNTSSTPKPALVSNNPKAKNRKGPSVDMVKDYYPPIDFRFVFPQVSPEVNRTRSIFIIVLVNSGARGEKYRNNRKAIRETWGNQSNCEQRKALGDKRLANLRWSLVFVVGKAGAKTNDDELNLAEARHHNDMLIGNITDNYKNNIVKLYMGLLWASKFDVKYTLKTDDDVYVRVPRVLEYLVNAKFPKQFSGGYLFRSTGVRRNIGGKWTISYKYYEKPYYPNYNPGAFLILSSDIFGRLFNHVYKRKPFHVDDAYLGVALHDLGVKITQIGSFLLKENSRVIFRNMTDCQVLHGAAFGHKLDPEYNRYLHARISRLACGRTNLKC